MLQEFARPGERSVESGRRVSRVAILVVVALAAAPVPADACFCPRACLPKPGASVFDATVTAIGAINESGLTGQIVVSLSEVTVLSGVAPRALVQTASSCDYRFRVGVRYRIDGEAVRTSNGRVAWASQCGATRPLWTWDLRAVPTMLTWWWSAGGCRS